VSKKFTKRKRVRGPVSEKEQVRQAINDAVGRSKNHALLVKQVLAKEDDKMRHDYAADETGRFIPVPNQRMFQGYVERISQIITLRDLGRAMGLTEDQVSRMVENEIDKLFPKPATIVTKEKE